MHALEILLNLKYAHVCHLFYLTIGIGLQETAASKEAFAEAEKAEEIKHAKWLEAEKAGKAADEYAAKKLDKVEEVLHGKMEAMSLKAQVDSCLTQGSREF